MATNTTKKGSEVVRFFPRLQHYFDRYKQSRGRVGFSKLSRTKQSDLESCDINNILRRYVKTGELAGIKSNPIFGDFSSSVDFKESMELVIFAQEQFAALPARVRDRFNNSPAEFLAFCDDPKNVDEMVAMGLATKRVDNAVPAPKSGGDSVSPGSVKSEDSKEKDPK